MMKFLIPLLLCSCISPDMTQKTLESAGYSDIKIEGYAWFACSEDDTFHTSFTAKNPKDQEVSGVVCCGLFKNCTIRF